MIGVLAEQGTIGGGMSAEVALPIAQPAPVAAPAAEETGTFRALRYHDYRYLWLGQLGHSASLWMEQVVRPLLVYQLTHSGLLVGLALAVRMLPALVFGVVGGAVADRYDRRRVLMYCQSVTLSMHLLLGVLLVSGMFQLWIIFVTAFISGGAMAFNQPARQSLVPRLVPKEFLQNAIALNTTAMNLTRIGGAGLAGLLLVAFNYGEVYLLNAALYVFVIWTTTQIRYREQPSLAKRGSLFGDLTEGIRYVRGNQAAFSLITMAMILFVFGMPYQQLFIPLFALKVLGIGKGGAGALMAATGIGAVTASLFVASRATLRRRGLIANLAIGLYGVSLIVFAQSSLIAVSVAALVVTGGLSMVYMNMNNTLLLENTPPEYQGRVMSLMIVNMGLTPIGAILGGALADSLGPQTALMIMAFIVMGLAALVFVFFPVARRLS
jgi:MFS family permease